MCVCSFPFTLQADVEKIRGEAYIIFGIILFFWELLPTSLVVVFFRVQRPNQNLVRTSLPVCLSCTSNEVSMKRPKHKQNDDPVALPNSDLARLLTAVQESRCFHPSDGVRSEMTSGRLGRTGVSRIHMRFPGVRGDGRLEKKTCCVLRFPRQAPGGMINSHSFSSRAYFFDNPRRYDSDDDLSRSAITRAERGRCVPTPQPHTHALLRFLLFNCHLSNDMLLSVLPFGPYLVSQCMVHVWLPAMFVDISLL